MYSIKLFSSNHITNSMQKADLVDAKEICRMFCERNPVRIAQIYKDSLNPQHMYRGTVKGYEYFNLTT